LSHLPILPILIPFVAAALMLLLRPAAHRALGLAATLLGLLAAVALVAGAAGGDISVYALGNWLAPYGIVLVVDRIAAMMVLLVFALALAALLLASVGIYREGRHFHPLFQLQLAGLAGAFLTGDLFNLFVFFEILLLASYALLLHGGGADRARAGMHYVVLNLLGSAVFLVSIAFLYGTLGTLNLADVAQLLPLVPPENQALVRTAFASLAAVFLLKAAVLPMALWLPRVYSAAPAPAAVLFAIMTKVGVVALLRLSVTGFGTASATQGLLLPWLPILALATILLGTAGVFAAPRLATLAANLVLLSTGTLLFAVAFAGPAGTAALLYYLPHTTLVTGGLFLLAALIAERRGSLGDALVRGPCVGNRAVIAAAFGTLAVAASGLPPLSGFLGKLMLLQSVGADGWRTAWWLALLGSGLAVTLVFARSAALLFWQPLDPLPRVGFAKGHALALGMLVAASPLVTLAAAPIAAYAEAASAQLHARTPTIDAVLQGRPIDRERRP
jgi:multicomponent K+:H+ antiporter subunit D